LGAVPEQRRSGVLQKMIQDEVMSVLSITDRARIGLGSPLSEFGLDSMMSIELRNVLGDVTGAELSGTLLFDYPTIEVLAAHLLEEVIVLSDASGGEAAGDDAAGSASFNNEGIAVLGMSCRMPGGGDTPQQFWERLSSGEDCVSTVPLSRWDHSYFLDTENHEAPGKAFTDRGGFLTCPVDEFDPKFFNISGREAERMDPAQRFLLECTWEAMEIAGVCPDDLMNSRTGVFVGMCANDYSLLEAKGGDLSAMTGHYGTGVSHAVAAGRISYTFGFKGPSFAIDTACSSALIAVHQACMSLKTGETNCCIAAGSHLLLSPDLYINFAKAKMLSPNGRCATFDAEGDGFCRGEGCASVVLKRMSDAVRDGDLIQAVIMGSATNQDGRSNSLTAPNGPSQQSCIKDALRMSGLKPTDISYLEAHGTGTSLGDPIEVQAAGAVYGKGRTVPLVMGSIKSVMGHLEAAAGLSGMAKILVMMQNEKIPANLHFKTVNPMIDLDSIPATVPVSVMPWKTVDNRLVGGVSSFGFGGSNCHVILEKYRQTFPEPIQFTPLHCFVLSAKSEKSLIALAAKYVLDLETNTAPLQNICYTTGVGRAHFPSRVAISCSSVEELKESLAAFAAGTPKTNTVSGKAGASKVAFMFTGQGCQYVNMGKELYATQPVFKEALESCAEILKTHNVPLLSILFPEKAGDTRVDETEFTQPCLFAIEYSIAKLWESWGVNPGAVIGHSVGEIVAACIAGVFSLEDGLKIIAKRAALMASVPKEGTMVAVFTSEEEVTKIIAPFTKDVSIAAINGPKLIVISGRKSAIKSILKALTAKKVTFKELTVSNAFHSPLMEPILDQFQKVVKGCELDAGFVDVISGVTGKLVDGSTPIDAKYWANHIRAPVRFADTLQAAKEAGFEQFLEIGPDPILTGMAKRCITDGNNTLRSFSFLSAHPSLFFFVLCALLLTLLTSFQLASRGSLRSRRALSGLILSLPLASCTSVAPSSTGRASTLPSPAAR
jgi:acyl transferase domain-containing protein/acyl carrier protein